MILRQKLTISAMAVYALSLLISTHISIPDIVYRADVSDKWLHFFAYLNLTFLVWHSIKPFNSPDWRKPLVWLILVFFLVFAAMDEITQPYFGRTADFYDFASDSVGVLAGLVIFTFMSYWPSLMMALAITIFSITNLAKADLSKLVPVMNALFNFLSYAFFTLIWIQVMKLYLFYKSQIHRFILALIIPVVFMLLVKAGSLLLKRHFGNSDLFFGALGILAVCGGSLLKGFLKSQEKAGI